MRLETSAIHVDGPAEVFVYVRHALKYKVQLVLFLATLFTTVVVGVRLQFNFNHHLAAFSSSEQSLPMFPLRWIFEHPSNLLLGVPFALALMGILLAHEMGHYLYCRKYQVDATLPYFIPAPTLIGTVGAFIKIRSVFRSRAALFDIGIAGPIAGFVVALPITVLGLALSQPFGKVPEADIQVGFPLLFRMIHYAMVATGHYANQPLEHVLLHPLAIAGWVGMFATSLNLLPGGQLDGGHMVFAFSPRAHRIISTIAILALLPMAYFFWAGWLIWAVVLWITARRQPVVYDFVAMDRRRAWLLGIGVLMLALSIIPAPFADSGIMHVRGDFLQAGHDLGHALRSLFHH